MSIQRRPHPFLVAAGIHAALVLPLAVLTRLTPVCLPGLIDYNADLEALLFGTAPALAAGFSLTPTHPTTWRLFWIWGLTQLLHLPDGPGQLPNILTLGFLIALAFRVAYSRCDRLSQKAALGVGLALLALSAAALTTAIGARLHDFPLRNDGRLAGVLAVLGLALIQWLGLTPGAVAAKARQGMRQLITLFARPEALLIAAGGVIRLLFPYDLMELTLGVGLWVTGFILLGWRFGLNQPTQH